MHIPGKTLIYTSFTLQKSTYVSKYEKIFLREMLFSNVLAGFAEEMLTRASEHALEEMEKLHAVRLELPTNQKTMEKVDTFGVRVVS